MIMIPDRKAEKYDAFSMICKNERRCDADHGALAPAVQKTVN
jgi:hypothetical protein